MRGRQEHISLATGDILLKETSNGREYLEFNEKLTKTRHDQDESGSHSPKIFAEIGTNNI